MTRPALFVALDGLLKRPDETWAIVQQLHDTGLPFGLKINVDYLLQRGLDHTLPIATRYERPVFADVKAWNGARTLGDLVDALVQHGIAEVTIHAIAEGQLEAAAKKSQASKGKPRILANTLLTHYSEAYCQRIFRRSRRETVEMLAQIAKEQGCQGVTLPGEFLDIAQRLGLDSCVPGIRPEGYPDDGRHEDPTTPEDAARGGATLVVCGSPIMKAQDPVEALRGILRSLGHAA